MDLKDFALGMALFCVRNTVIEQYHADGKLTDEEMKAFNKEVANKLYTVLLSTTSPDEKERQAAFAVFAGSRPYNWDAPQPDEGIRKAIRRAMRTES